MRIVYDNSLITTWAQSSWPLQHVQTLDYTVTKLVSEKPKVRDKLRNKYFHSLFKNFCVMDGVQDTNFQDVISEARLTVGMADPAFQVFMNIDFERFIKTNQYMSRWNKIEKDYHAYITKELKRRNKHNPYLVDDMVKEDDWNKVPDYRYQKPHQPWQFDHIYRDSQYLAGQVYELTQEYKKLNDTAAFRAKINSILVARQIVTGLNTHDFSHDFPQIEMSIINIKLSLDAAVLSYMFLNRTVESLHKIRWSGAYPKELIDEMLGFSDQLLKKLKERIQELERRFMLFMQSDLDQEW